MVKQPLPQLDIAAFLRQGALLFPHPGAHSGGGLDRAWIGWGEAHWAPKEDPALFSVYAPDFFLRAEKPWLCFERRMELGREELLVALLENPDQDLPVPEVKWTEPSTQGFLSAFEGLQAEFSQGTLKKAVPVVFEQARARVDAAMKRKLLCSLLIRSRELPVRPYGFWTAEEGILGATPESLFALDSSRRLDTVALAGTRPTGESDRLPLLDDPKERHEHQLVVQGITEAIRDAGWGAPWVGETSELKLPTFSHLQTPLAVDLREDTGLEALARVLHPTPALGAFPKLRGKDWLEHQDQTSSVDRRRFGAPFGAATGVGSAQCWVAIRNLQWERIADSDEETLWLGAGCGIVPESQADREWSELRLKIQSVKKFFDL